MCISIFLFEMMLPAGLWRLDGEGWRPCSREGVARSTAALVVPPPVSDYVE